jgi:hypothetical protein
MLPGIPPSAMLVESVLNPTPWTLDMERIDVEKEKIVDGR